MTLSGMGGSTDTSSPSAGLTPPIPWLGNRPAGRARPCERIGRHPSLLCGRNRSLREAIPVHAHPDHRHGRLHRLSSCAAALRQGHLVTGIDGMTTYYDVTLKRERTAILLRSNALSRPRTPARGHGAPARRAEADSARHHRSPRGTGGRSLQPRKSARLCRRQSRRHVQRHGGRARTQPRPFAVASTSSVYGANAAIRSARIDRADHPLTLYAATKKAGRRWRIPTRISTIPTTLFRFFTVYGPWGRPDMALFKFVARHAARTSRSTSMDMARCRATSPISTISSKAIVRLIACVPEIGARAADEFDSFRRWRRFASSTSAAAQPVALLDFIAAAENERSAKRRSATISTCSRATCRSPSPRADLLER